MNTTTLQHTPALDEDLESYLDNSPTAAAAFDRWGESLPFHIAKRFIGQHGGCCIDGFLSYSDFDPNYTGPISLVLILIYLGY